MYIKVNNTKYNIGNLTIKQFQELVNSSNLKGKKISFKRIGA